MRLSTEKAIEFVENLEKYHPIQKYWDESNERHRQEKNTENYPYSYFRDVLIRKIAEIIEALQQENEQLHELAKAKADGRLVEVVRCGKCRHYNTTGCSDGCGWCENMDRGVFDEHYCSRGERREKE